MKSLLHPTKQFHYKGSEKQAAQSPIRKHAGLTALAASIERGKELVK